MLQEKSPILIMFKSRSIGDYGSLKQLYYRYNYHHRRQAQPQQQEQENQQLHRLIHLYHFSRHFDHETCITHTLCNAVYWIDWRAPFEIPTIEESSATNKNKNEEEIETYNLSAKDVSRR